MSTERDASALFTGAVGRCEPLREPQPGNASRPRAARSVVRCGDRVGRAFRRVAVLFTERVCFAQGCHAKVAWRALLIGDEVWAHTEFRKTRDQGGGDV